MLSVRVFDLGCINDGIAGSKEGEEKSEGKGDAQRGPKRGPEGIGLKLRKVSVGCLAPRRCRDHTSLYKPLSQG